jgi:mannose-6-phosphate isomerase-like protein (cupin superfamily)
MIVKRDAAEAIDFEGLRILDYTAELDLRSSFAVIIVPPGANHAEAWSKRSDKYYYVVDGEIEFTLAGEAHVLSAGDFCVVAQGQRFSYRNTGTAEAKIHLIQTPSFDLDLLC